MAQITLVLSILCSTWYIVLWGIALVGFYSARKRYRTRPRSPTSTAAPTTVPGVSILRPLKGLDVNLYENLESTFQQEYPTYEIIFSVADEQDQALVVVNRLLEKYPAANARVIVGEQRIGVNPKVNNLIRPYNEAKYDILWVLDSNITVASGTLARAVDALTQTPKSPSAKRISLVHHVPFAFVSHPSLGSKVEEAFLNTNHAKMYIALNTFAIESCVMGKSNLYRKSDLEQVDGSLKLHLDGSPAEEADRGLRAFGQYMAEDNMIASSLWKELDTRHDLSCDVALNAIGDMSLGDYILRRVRWIRVRKHMVLSATLLEPFTESVFIGALTSICVRHLTGFPIWLFLVFHFQLWLAVDLDVYKSLAGHSPPSGTLLWFLTAWAIRELLAFPIWFFAVIGSEVVWRGKKYHMLRNGEVRLAQASTGGLRNPLTWLRTRARKSLDNYEPLEQAHD